MGSKIPSQISQFDPEKTADPKVVVAPTHVRDDVGEVVGADM